MNFLRIIQKLDVKTINQIAAGEVVEAPRSVVKELVENAIDAKATHITIEIQDGGIDWISVMDNGVGIHHDDLEMAFMSHATSKLKQVEDLQQILSLGFRGEALASIASVSQVQIISKTKEEDTGTKLELHGGEVKQMERVATTTGTKIVVRNLFYNVVARRKFLKKSSIEAGYISDLIHKFALGNPHISFSYINNQKMVLHTSGNGDLKSAIFYVYGKEITKNMIPISIQKDGYEITGMLATPQSNRSNRNHETLFINGRFIKNKLISNSVEQAYKTRMIHGKFPIFILNFSIPTKEVDINVHPTKLQVRFKDDTEISELFYTSVAELLEKEVLASSVTIETKKLESKKLESNKKQLERNHIKPITSKSNQLPYQANSMRNKSEYRQKETTKVEPIQRMNFLRETKKTIMKTGQTVQELLNRKTGFQASKLNQIVAPLPLYYKEETKSKAKDYRIIGECFEAYWLIEKEESLYLIDQSALQERMLFEKFLNQFEASVIPSERLEESFFVALSSVEQAILEENEIILKDFGFSFEQKGEEYSLQGVPLLLKNITSADFFVALLERLCDDKIRSVYQLKLQTIALVVCQEAIQMREAMNKLEIESLLVQFWELENPFACAYGRKTIVEVKKEEIGKMFLKC